MKKYKIRYVVGNENEYDRIKNILNIGKHPSFIGRDTVRSNAANGGLLFMQCDNEDIGVALVNPSKNNLLVLNILPHYRGQGFGKIFLDYLKPNFARVIETKKKWFQANGYIAIGKPKKGIRYETYIMLRRSLREHFLKSVQDDKKVKYLLQKQARGA